MRWGRRPGSERRAVEREAAALTARSGEMARDGGGDDRQGPVRLAARAGSSGPRWARSGPDLGQEGRRGGARWRRRRGDMAALDWTRDGGGHVRHTVDVSGGARKGETRVSSGFRGRDLYIGMEGARKLQMECGFRPCDRDQML